MATCKGATAENEQYAVFIPASKSPIEEIARNPEGKTEHNAGHMGSSNNIGCFAKLPTHITKAGSCDIKVGQSTAANVSNIYSKRVNVTM